MTQIVPIDQIRNVATITEKEMTRWFNDALMAAANKKKTSMSVLNDLDHSQTTTWISSMVVANTMHSEHPFAVVLEKLRTAGYTVTIERADHRRVNNDISISWQLTSKEF